MDSPLPRFVSYLMVSIDGQGRSGRSVQAGRQAIAALVASVVGDMIAAGDAVPDAISDRRYSGSFLTRVPEQLHRTLAIEAAEAGISLNRLVNYKLSMAVPMAGRPAKAASRAHKAA